MTNKEIAAQFQLLGNLMELHGENRFKIRSYQNAYINLRKVPLPLAEMEEAEINNLKGVGKAIAGKIGELLSKGTMDTLERYKQQTPEGIQEMLKIKGFGPKKIEVIWKELEVESIGELLYAVNENRLVELKGFGAKTQEDLKQKLEYYQKTKDQFHFASLDEVASQLEIQLRNIFPDRQLARTGATVREENIASAIEFLMMGTEDDFNQLDPLFTEMDFNGTQFTGRTEEGIPVIIHLSGTGNYGELQFLLGSDESFLKAFFGAYEKSFPDGTTEASIFESRGLPFIPYVLRSSDWGLSQARQNKLPKLIEAKDIKGVVHNHSTYSDGMQSILEMANYSKELGYEYLVMTDHSKSAFYANGLQAERVLEQFAEIDQLNQELENFRILKGIECDILNDGSLDYDDDILAQFEVIIASVHSNLRMDEQKATQRILKAIENPYTHILGHPTGRLLLSRKGYPINHQLIIDACAENKVSIELNANPYRLDLDWTWIPYAIEKGVLISINPDAHSTQGIHHIKYGVASARKGGLQVENCLNAKPLEDFLKAIKK